MHLLKTKRKESHGVSIICRAMEFGFSLVSDRGTEKLLSRNDLSRLGPWEKMGLEAESKTERDD